MELPRVEVGGRVAEKDSTARGSRYNENEGRGRLRVVGMKWRLASMRISAPPPRRPALLSQLGVSILREANAKAIGTLEFTT